MLLQYWKVKAAHFDKIALFKVGKFYEVFYYDAFVANYVCDLKWMNSDKKPHVGFPEMAKHDYAKRLVAAGYKVVVVEQVERVLENKQRTQEAKAQEKGASNGPTCIQREACEVFTKGTVVDPGMLGSAGARFMLYLHMEGDALGSGNSRGNLAFAACMVDCATSQIRVGRVEDSTDRNALRTLLAQVQPSEVVFCATNLPAEVSGLLRRLPCRPQLSTTREAQSTLAARDRMSRYNAQHPGKLPEPVSALLASSESALCAAAGALCYLEAVLLGSRVLPYAVWDMLEVPCGPQAAQAKASESSKRMVLDATALSALEILETLEGSYKGSLLEFLDQTSTPFGSRLLKQWLCAPLYDVNDIGQRQDAVEFFIERPDVREQLRSALKKVCGGSTGVDLERATARVWGYAQQAERHAVMYEDVTAKRLMDFATLLRAYEQCIEIVGKFARQQNTLPERLGQICKPVGAGGAFPELSEIITRLGNSVVATPSSKGGTTYRPRPGVNATYDSITKQLEGVNTALEKELQGLRTKYPKLALIFVHRLPGFRFEIECDEDAAPEALLRSVDITSRPKGKVRFHTTRIKELVVELDALEDRREDCVWPVLSSLFQGFYEHQASFRTAARLLAELDAFLGLATASQALAGGACRAQFSELKEGEGSRLELRCCRHPVAAAKMGTSFVPNNTLIGTGGVPSVLVVTGPNMGGKSTVLRQTCIAVIMAQLGCRVNAEACILTPVDRIFTRIGSYDTILEGKSTLLTELEETAALLAHGTERSLAVLDELGRGTSTFDGAAIAAAVLDELATRVRCMVLFATHYHPVSREAVRSPSIAPFHMAADVDEATGEMTFLYRFLPGLCPASHGHNVARLAGLPEKVLEEAIARSRAFEAGGAAAAEAQGLAADLARLAEAGDTEGIRQLWRRRSGRPC